jgi:hypothetical protein
MWEITGPKEQTEGEEQVTQFSLLFQKLNTYLDVHIRDRR